MKIRYAVAAVLGAVAAIALAGPAQAHHNAVDATLEVDGCTVTAGSSWTIEDHKVGNTAVVVLANGETVARLVGEGFTVELEPGTETVEWRVWGGGERGYDSPALTDLDALLAHLAGGGGELDANAPGVAWHTLAVADCPAPASPTPDPTPSADPTTPAPSPSLGTDETPTPGAGGGLPVTGTPVLLIGGAGAGLLAVGGGVLLLTRRRRVDV